MVAHMCALCTRLLPGVTSLSYWLSRSCKLHTITFYPFSSPLHQTALHSCRPWTHPNLHSSRFTDTNKRLENRHQSHIGSTSMWVARRWLSRLYPTHFSSSSFPIFSRDLRSTDGERQIQTCVCQDLPGSASLHDPEYDPSGSPPSCSNIFAVSSSARKLRWW